MLSPIPRRSDWGYCIAHFTQPYQPSLIWRSGRPAQRPFRDLLSVHSRYGLHTRAVTIFCDSLYRRLQPLRCLHSCSGCFRLERLPGGTFTHWESAAFSRRTLRSRRTIIARLLFDELISAFHLRTDDHFRKPDSRFAAFSDVQIKSLSDWSWIDTCRSVR